MVREPLYHIESTVDLFQEEAACHLVSECEWGKREAKVRSAPHRLRKPLVASDNKHQIARGLVSMFGKPGGKPLGRQTFSGGVQQDNVVQGVNPRQQFLALQDCQSAFGSLRLHRLNLTQGQLAKMLQSGPIVFDETLQMNISSLANP